MFRDEELIRLFFRILYVLIPVLNMVMWTFVGWFWVSLSHIKGSPPLHEMLMMLAIVNAVPITCLGLVTKRIFFRQPLIFKSLTLIEKISYLANVLILISPFLLIFLSRTYHRFFR